MALLYARGSQSRGFVAAIVCAAFAWSATGCATAIHGTSQNIPFAVQPNGTKITVYRWNGEVVVEGRSPDNVDVRRPQKGQSYLVKEVSDGYCPRYVLARNNTASVVGSIELIVFLATLGVIWLIPFMIDSSTGAAYVVDKAPFVGALPEVTSCSE